jgi:vacuolar-type H+-ATPase subunit D/Vma8
MSNPDSQIMDLLSESRAINKKLQAAQEESTIRLQELEERNKVLEEELAATRRMLTEAEKAIPVSCLRGL